MTRSAYPEILMHPLHDFIAGEQQRDDRKGHVEDAEKLPRRRFRVHISVADRRDRDGAEVNGVSEIPPLDDAHRCPNAQVYNQREHDADQPFQLQQPVEAARCEA